MTQAATLRGSRAGSGTREGDARRAGGSRRRLDDGRRVDSDQPDDRRRPRHRIAAVLGATAFANTYQFTNSLPNLVFYGLLGGRDAVVAADPRAGPAHRSGDAPATERVAGGFLGIIALGAAVPRRGGRLAVAALRLTVRRPGR